MFKGIWRFFVSEAFKDDKYEDIDHCSRLQ